MVLGTYTNNKLDFTCCYIIYIGYNICMKKFVIRL